jgi:hypothetical protein
MGWTNCLKDIAAEGKANRNFPFSRVNIVFREPVLTG